MHPLAIESYNFAIQQQRGRQELGHGIGDRRKDPRAIFPVRSPSL